MANRIGRRMLAAGGAALLPAAGLVASARAQGAGESTLDRIRRTKTLRIAALPGELPYFQKDISSGAWSGAAIEMANSIAKLLDAKLEYTEATYGTSVLDVQTGKIDLAFALNPTPERALAVRFTHPMLIHPFGCLAKPGLEPKTWADINKPDIRIAFDIGSLHETVAKRFAPNAQHVGFPNRDQALLALQAGRADVDILAALLGLSATAKNPSLGHWDLLQQPTVALPSSLACQYEADTRFVDMLNAWLDFNRGIGQLREWLIDGLELEGVKRDQIPPELTF
ncbi:MAG TPA: transporter substrate-binding domain-containing protein [Acetobacteraceae bacterium]|nr:transporter substrate-binding domain-containing protein [Acetobacteraceae bacterium]